MKKICMMIIIVLSTLMMFSCATTHQLPKPKGQKVQLSELELGRKLGLLELEHGADNILKSQVISEYTENEPAYHKNIKVDMISYVDKKNNLIWVDSNFEVHINEGTFKGIAKGFENEYSSYFDIQLDNNNQFEDTFDKYKNYYNGSYKMNKSTSSWGLDRNRLAYIFSDLAVENMIVEQFAYTSYDYDFIKKLHQLGFEGLSFYMSDATFSIQLDIKNSHLRTVSDEIKEVIKGNFGLNTNIVEYYEMYIILNFDKNKLVEVGIKHHLKTEELVNDAFHKFEGIVSIIQSIVDKTPDAINYGAYTKIESLDEITKF